MHAGGQVQSHGEVLEQLEDPSPVLSNGLPKLEFLGIGHELKLGSFQLSECSDELNSRDIGEISSSTPEPGMSFVKVFTSVPLEPNAKSRQLECSADLEFSQIDDSTGNPSTRGHYMLLLWNVTWPTMSQNPINCIQKIAMQTIGMILLVYEWHRQAGDRIMGICHML